MQTVGTREQGEGSTQARSPGTSQEAFLEYNRLEGLRVVEKRDALS